MSAIKGFKIFLHNSESYFSYQRQKRKMYPVSMQNKYYLKQEKRGDIMFDLFSCRMFMKINSLYLNVFTYPSRPFDSCVSITSMTSGV